MAKPKLRFPEFMDEWEKTTLEKKAYIYDGTHQTPQYVSKGIKFVSVENIHDIYGTDKFISVEAYNKYKIKPKVDDILMTRITAGVIGDTAIITEEEPLAYYVSLALIRKKGEINSRFLAYDINSIFFKHELHKRIIHVAFPKKINLRDIGKCKIAFPKESEQQKIADFLSFVDDIIQVQEEEITALEEQKKGMMQKLFNREVRFKADDGSEYPEWEEKRIDEVCQIVGGGTPSTSNAEFWNGNIQWFTPTEVGKSKYVYTSERTITEKGIQESSAKLLPKGTILLSTRATIGEMSIAGQECCTNQGFQSMIVNGDCSNEYIYYLQNTIKAYALKNSSGSTFLEISKNNLGKCILPIPCIKEQEKIVGCLSAYDEAIQIKKIKLEIWKEIKKGLLQQMFV